MVNWIRSWSNILSCSSPQLLILKINSFKDSIIIIFILTQFYHEILWEETHLEALGSSKSFIKVSAGFFLFIEVSSNCTFVDSSIFADKTKILICTLIFLCCLTEVFKQINKYLLNWFARSLKAISSLDPWLFTFPVKLVHKTSLEQKSIEILIGLKIQR